MSASEPTAEYRVSLCANCVVWHFNRDDSGLSDSDPRPLARWDDVDVTLTDVFADPIEHFSWSDCEGCGAMAGTRYDYLLTVWGE